MPELEHEESLDLTEGATKLSRFLVRRRWWILVPFFGLSLITIGVLSFIPDRYTSAATLVVVQQQVPQRYVVPNSTTDVTSALQAMKQEVLSRSQLLRLVNDFSLYPKQRKRLAPERLISLVLQDIEIVPIIENPQRDKDKDIDAFRISFTTDDRYVAQQVTNTLTSLFINEYLRTGTEQANNTTNFLHKQVEEKAKELAAQEERLRDFKIGHVGELPEQQPGNLGILTGLQGQLQNTMVSMNRAQQQRALLQAQLDATPRRRYGSETNPALIPTPASPSLNPLQSAQNEVARLEAAKSNLLSKGYTSQHPDVLRNQRELAQAESNLARLRAAAPPERPLSSIQTTAAAAPSHEPVDDPAIAQLRSSLEANRVEIDNLTAEEKRLKTVIAQYENRINQTPVREQQQASIVRDTEVLRQQYAELVKKEQESQLATNLEKQQGGQQFRLIDPASLPSLPSSPKRVKISLGGLVAGLALGFGLGFLMEKLDTSFHTERDLTKQLEPPFVIGIPLLRTPAETRQRKWWNVLQWLAASAMVLVVAAAEFYVYKRS